MKKNLAISLAGLLAVIAIAAYFLKPHATVGDWEDTDCSERLTIFRDKTAIHESALGKDLCVWSPKSDSLIVLKCRNEAFSRDLVYTFDSATGKAGNFDNSKILTNTEANGSSCLFMGFKIGRGISNVSIYSPG